jgi:hypothetical protein
MKNMLNPNKRERYIVLYSDEYDAHVWEDYCKSLGVNPSETEVRINFDYKDVIAGSEMNKL